MKKTYSLLFFLLGVCSSIFAQPANNNCASATALVVDAAPLCGQTTAAATTEAGENKPCGATGGQTVWYSFVATSANMSVWIDNLVSGGCHLASGVWNTGACLPAAPTILSCKGAAAPTDIWHHLSGLTPGNTYLISVVYGNGGPCNAGQTFCISVINRPTTAGINAPTTGIAGTYAGGCTTNSCTSFQYYDDGGPSSNYSLNVNQIYRTFCPNIAGNCIRATVNYVDMEPGIDFVRIRNGPTQNSTTLATLTMSGNGASYTSTDASGCLTISEYSDFSIVRAGFSLTVDCVPCSGAGPSGTTNSDCANATQVCNNANITGASTGPGLTSDGCAGCLAAGGENYTNWYVIQAQTSGNLLLTIDPTVNSDDYDFGLYGPGVSCATLGTPIRCSYAATPNPGNTGMGNGALDFSEGVTGDSWVAPLAVTAGDIYYLVVNKWDPTPGSGFTLFWTGGVGGSSTATLSCTPLPIELVYFNAQKKGAAVELKWTTSSEINNELFTIERSSDATNFDFVSSQPGSGNSNVIKNYTAIDNTPLSGLSYYRLKQTDYDGVHKYSVIVPVKFSNEEVTFNVYQNQSGDVLQYTYSCNKNTKAIISIYDYTGKNIYQKEVYCTQGNNISEIQLESSSSSMYFITFNTDETSFTKRIIKK